MKVVRLNGLAREADRFEVTSRLRDAIQASGGWITGHEQYSEVSICIQFEIPEQKLPGLAAAVRATGLELPEKSQQELGALTESEGEGHEAIGTVQVLFVKPE